MIRAIATLSLAFTLSGCIGTVVGVTKDVVVGTASIATGAVVGAVDITTDVVQMVIPGGSDGNDDDD